MSSSLFAHYGGGRFGVGHVFEVFEGFTCGSLDRVSGVVVINEICVLGFGFVGVHITFLKRRIVQSEMSTTGDGCRGMVRTSDESIREHMAHNRRLSVPSGQVLVQSESAESARSDGMIIGIRTFYNNVRALIHRSTRARDFM